MNHRLILQAELARILRQRFASKEWWIFVPVKREGLAMLRQIEERFYWDEAGNDFDVAALPSIGLAVAFGRKTRVPTKRLHKFLRKRSIGDIADGILKGRDVVVLGTAEDEALGHRLIGVLSDIMEQPYPEMN